MAQTKIDGKFYPLQNDEWLKATQELRYAEIRVLYYLRTLDPFGQQDNRIKVTDIANIIGLKKGTVSKALCTLKEKDYIHLEVSEAIVSINSFPTRNLVSYKKPRFLQETRKHHRKHSRTVGNLRAL
ncbi:MAG: helix-turn-helix domain-containing protein [Crocosphaera sp.]